ncbi:MAG: hydantoinase B/oxoprolinase family protein, partial [Alphaproteobacteria bacterium]|nr:hydantoinase B/oxoprolinase family protein [Alphaproteobacteria bacterium]
MALDPVFLEIFGNKVVATCEEMSLTLQRTSRTLFVKEAADFACALVGLDGRAVAYPRDTGCLGFCDFDAKPTIDAVPNLEPGDVIITNDPYTSGALSTHLPDIHLIEPHFHEGRIVSYGWTFVHSTDVGGGTPGSLKPSFDEIYQEGLRIPPMKLLERGVMDPKVEAMLRSNCRIPDLNMGDVRAMLAGQRVGRLRVAEIIARHGVETYLAGQKEVLDYSEAKARAVLRRIPDGEAEFWDYMDDDYVSPIPVRLRVKMTVRDGLVHFDVTGTDPELKSAFNVCAFDRMHEWTTLRFMTFISTYDPTVIPNHGMFRPLSMTNPRGTVLNCEFPAALGSRDRPARRLHDALNGALLKVAPDMMCAPSGGAGCVFFLAEYLTPDADERSVSVIEYIRGGMGAMKGLDGVDNRDASIANLSNNPIEVVERECGVLVREWNIQQDSGGPGQWRGGVGQRVTIEFLRDNGMLYGMGMDRMRFNAFGAYGGKPGSAFRIVYNLGRPNEREYGKVGEIPVNAGDTITAILPGGAGYGDPFLRDAQAVL